MRNDDRPKRSGRRTKPLLRIVSTLRSIEPNAVDRYSAKLLFQFRIDIEDAPSKRRRCEERIVVFEAKTAQAALKKSQRRGQIAEHSYTNEEGNAVHFEFIGIMDLLLLGVECDDDEVWYDVRERMLPMERRDKLIPPESELNAIRNATKTVG